MEQIYSRVTNQPIPEEPTVDVTSQAFYGKGYDDSDRRIPDMTLIQKQLCKYMDFVMVTCTSCLDREISFRTHDNIDATEDSKMCILLCSVPSTFQVGSQKHLLKTFLM